ncbi:MAG: hypothetical protein HDT21_09725 [Ruminococcus sp.]|nr:hypothetical protein [Ruminococcus sp.]
MKGVKTMNAGKMIINEIDSRLERLGNHYHDKKNTDGNPFGEMLSAESKLLNTALAGELRSLKEFVQEKIGTGD